MRLAHFTDLHLLSPTWASGSGVGTFLNKRLAGGLNLLLNRGKHYRPELFEAIVADLNAGGVDHVVCTGDVTNLALPSEFRFARAHFDRLALGPANVTCIPGNHDAYVPESDGRFEEAFAPYCEGDPDRSWPGGEKWPVVRVRGDLSVLACSSSLATGWGMAWGVLGEAQLARLEQALVRLRGTCRVVLVHHPCAGRRARHPRRGLRDHEAFAAVLRRAGAELVLHGHEHVGVEEALEGPAGPIPVRGLPSGTYDRVHRGGSSGSAGRGAGGPLMDRTARYRVYELAGGRVVGHEDRVWRPADRRFS